MQPVQVQHYVRRATDFLNGMEITRSDQNYLNSAALLAIHSALSYSDALRIGLGGEKLSAEDHSAMVSDLERLLASKRFDDQTGLTHLRGLVKRKSSIAYGSRRFDDQEYLGLVLKAERFAKWANHVGKQLHIEGWRDDGE